MSRVQVFLDEAHFTNPEPLWMVAGAVVPNVSLSEKQLVKTFDSLMGQSEQFDSPDRFDRFRRHGFHYVENNDVVKDAWIQAASQLGYRIHLVFSRNPWEVPSAILYTAMYRRLIAPIMRRYPDAKQRYIFEQQNELNRIFQPLVKDVAVSCEIDVSRVEARIGEKADPLLSIPDYVMGAFARALNQESQEFQKRAARSLALSLAHALDFDKLLHKRRGRAVL